MIRLRISSYGMESITTLIDSLAHPNLDPLAMTLGRIMVEGNRDGLLAGTDSFGDPMAPVEESTIRRGRGGDGEPLNPRGPASRAIADFEFAIERMPDRTLVVGTWPNSPFIHFHATGTRNMVARDPVGIRPETADRMAESVADFALTLFSRS